MENWQLDEYDHGNRRRTWRHQSIWYLYRQPREDAEFKITPDSGYRILTVEVDGKTVELSDGTYRFTDVKEDHRIHAEFETIANPAPPYIPPAPPTPRYRGADSEHGGFQGGY